MVETQSIQCKIGTDEAMKKVGDMWKGPCV